MAAHRYYRLRMLENWGLSGTKFLGIELRTSVGGANVALTGNGTASADSTGYGAPADAFDGSNTTWWLGSVGVAAWIKWDFGAGNEQEIAQIAIVQENTVGGNPNYHLKNGTLQYSDDDTNWFTHVDVSGNPNGFGTFTYLAIIPGVADVTGSFARISAFDATVGADTDVTLKPVTGAIQGGANIAGTTTPATISGLAHESSMDTAVVTTLKPLSGVGYGGGVLRAQLDPIVFSASATSTNVARVNVALGHLTCTASATVSNVASINATWGYLGSNWAMVGYAGAILSATLNGLTSTSTATVSNVGNITATLPLLVMEATATAQNVASIEGTLGALFVNRGATLAVTLPPLTMTAIGHAVVAVTYEAYAVNLKHQPKPGKEPNDEVTRYTNFPFTHIVRYKNSYFGANSTGLYLLDGTTDYASPTPTPIPWAFKTAMTDFKSQQHKTVASAYFGGRLGAAATIDLHVGEDGPQTYSYATVRTDHAQNYRQVFGKGTKARYYALGASGTGTLELDDIDLDVHTLSRRI